MNRRVLIATIVEGYSITLDVEQDARGRSFYAVRCSCTNGACCVELSPEIVHDAFDQHAASHRSVERVEQMGLAL